MINKAKFSCISCGNIFYKPLHRLKYDKNQYCTRKCMYEYRVGENHPGYKGGNITDDGYKRIYVNKKCVLEHRYVVEKHIGRKLKATEHVHHIDKNKLNNDINNLKIVSNSEHHMIHMLDDIDKNQEVRGVSFDKSRGKWFARISYHKKNIPLGRYRTIEEAIRVRKEAELRYGYISHL